MIKEFVERWEKNKAVLRERYRKERPDNYEAIVRNVVELLHDEDEYESIDPERIHKIDDGDYQGTLVFVIAASGYQPNKYWYVRVSYGSCSVCDALESIREWEDEISEEETNGYMTLSLHVVQRLKQMDGDEE